MGRESDAMQGYLSNPVRFADFFNGCHFHGEPIVKAEELSEGSEVYYPEYLKVLDQAEGTQAGKTSGKQNNGKSSGQKQKEASRTRDLKMLLKNGECLRILAIEHQHLVNYIMPWRHMYYDALEYGKQIREKVADNQKEKNLKSSEAFLSGITSEDRLAPVFTTCLYLGTEPWTGPRSLKDMMDFGEDKDGWKNFFTDYKMNLICVNEITDFSVFHTNLKQLLMLLAYREDKEKMAQIIISNPDFAQIDRETAYVASVILGKEQIMETIENEGDSVNMCRAIREILADERAEGRAEGRDSMSKLITILIGSNRIEDLNKAAEDHQYQVQLLKEYGLISS